jgi:DNA-directed RNA polymerase alpha subunit
MDMKVHEELADLLAVPHMGARVRNMLAMHDVETMEQLLTVTECEWLCTPNVGRVSVRLLKEALGQRGLKLGQWPPIDRVPNEWWQSVLSEQT